MPERARLLREAHGDGHLHGAAAGQQLGLKHDVARHLHRVLQVALELVEDVLGAAAQQNRARLGVRALLKEAKVVVADLLDLKEPAARAHVGLVQLVGKYAIMCIF